MLVFRGTAAREGRGGQRGRLVLFEHGESPPSLVSGFAGVHSPNSYLPKRADDPSGLREKGQDSQFACPDEQAYRRS